ncbi:MAG: zf-HC2 domain-containing protein [Myxococcota bacterium]
MPNEREGCRVFRDLLHRHLDDALDLADEATFVGHMAVCARCRGALDQFNSHIQAHRVLASGGRMDAATARALKRALPEEFSALSGRVVRSRARKLGQLKFQVLQVYAQHILNGHAWPPLLDPQALQEAEDASNSLLDNLARYKEDDMIFADGGPVVFNQLRRVLSIPLDQEHEGMDHQLRHIARGLLTARTLNPELDEHVLQLLGMILERLGHYQEAQTMFLSLAELQGPTRYHLRARALNSAARTSLRYLQAFEQARRWLEEAAALYPQRWTIEYNLASLYLWPSNPNRNERLGRAYFLECVRHCHQPEKLEQTVDADETLGSTLRRLMEEEHEIESVHVPRTPLSAHVPSPPPLHSAETSLEPPEVAG